MTLALLTDLHELNMAAVYLRRGMVRPATFSLFVRRRPAHRAGPPTAASWSQPDSRTAGLSRNVEAGRRYGLPLASTMAHSFIEASATRSAPSKPSPRCSTKPPPSWSPPTTRWRGRDRRGGHPNAGHATHDQRGTDCRPSSKDLASAASRCLPTEWSPRPALFERGLARAGWTEPTDPDRRSQGPMAGLCSRQHG